ncbi:hypothetical protein AU193_08595 [Mycobacterium sp. GA-1285]|uniref:ESX-1 secretion-associated protein n=1 Tax=Mycobacterium sp. GA-1285 TaxID=1772282 RepID=UPI0007461683|nr:ESX-1 secretion-associated protein [Mycobacterium sp. GA-1285]KUI14076.1 hypothetical protein AU193_08595 [Mycobacterium sp. GA-1285]
MSQLFAQTDGLRSSASIHDRVATSLSQVLGDGAPEASGVQTSHGQIAAAVGTALSSVLDARLGTMQSAAHTGETISELLRKAAQMYEQGDRDGAETLRAAAEMLEDQWDTQGSASGSAAGAGGLVDGAATLAGVGAPANGAASAPGGDQMVGQLLGQVGQQVGQLVGSTTAPLLGLAQGLQQVPQMIAQGVQQAARDGETFERDDDGRLGEESELTGERSDEDVEEPSESRRVEPKAVPAPHDSTGAVPAPEAPVGAEPPRPAQTRPPVG